MNSKNQDMSTWVFGGVLLLVGVFLLIGLVIVNSQADNITTNVTVSNVAPTIGAVTISDSSLGSSIGTATPTASTSPGDSVPTPYYAHAIVTDTNGCDDVSAANSYSLFCLDVDGNGVCGNAAGEATCNVAGDANSDTCLLSTSCSIDSGGAINSCSGGPDNTVALGCSVNLLNFSEYTDNGAGQWLGKIVASDVGLSTITSASTSFEVATVTSATYCENIAFGSLAIGQNSIANGGGAVTCAVSCGGNKACDTDVYMVPGGAEVPALDCSGSGYIHGSQVAFDSLSYGAHSSFPAFNNLGTVTAGSPFSLDLGNATYPEGDNDPSLADPTSDSNVYLSIDVNSGIGTCTGTTVFTTTASAD